MEFRVLGPVEAIADGQRVQLGGRKPRLLLAALLVHDGHVVPADRLIDMVWGDDPPDTARALIHTYISSLRRVLARPGEEDAIATLPPGYVLRLAPERLDSKVFEGLAADARSAAHHGRYEAAVETFRAAERLWRGPAYSGIGDTALSAEAVRLDELRLSLIEERIAAELRLGRYADLVVELTALIATYPTHERLRGQLLLVLYRLGRQADALAVYRQGRESLIEHLGIEPGPHLRGIHEAILRSDPALLDRPATVEPAEPPRPPRRPGGPAPGERAVVPAQLPSLPADFTGRATEIADLLAALPSGSGATCVIAGKGGAGKSTLAVRVAHDLAAEYPDGQLYAELRGTSGSPAPPDEVLGRFLRALGADPATLPESMDERVERFRTIVATRRVLVVLDDAGTEQQVRPLIPGGPRCAVLITARRRLPGLAGANLTDLDVLESGEAVGLLARIAGAARVAAEPAAADRIVALCGCLPLAVRIVGARLATRRHWSLELMAHRLADERCRLDELAVADQQVRAGIDIAYRGLEPAARAALRGLGTLGLPDFPGWLVACLLAVPTGDGDNLIEQLVDAQLIDFARVDCAGQLRYRLHELVRLYAWERAGIEDPPAERAAAVRRVAGCWLWLIDQIGNSAPTGAIPLNPVLFEPHEPEPLVAKPILANGRAWLDDEQQAMVVGVERAAAMDLADVSVALATALCGSVFAVGNLFEAWGRTHAAALAAARRAGDRAAEATLLAQLGQLRCDQDRYAEAHEYLIQALALFRESGDQRGAATVLAALGATCREQGRLSEAMHFFRQAQPYFRVLGIDPAIGYVGRLVGATRLEQGDFAGARDDLREAVAAYRRSGSRRGEALTLRNLGLVHRATGELEQAYELSRQALSIFDALGDELLAAYGLQSVGKTLIRLGRGDEAADLLDSALETCRRVGDRWGEAFMLRTRGELHLAAGRLAAAAFDLVESIRCWTVVDVPLCRARTQRDLAVVREAAGDAASARALRLDALGTFREYGAREFDELGGVAAMEALTEHL